MAETVTVNFSGAALASLLYENVKSKSEQEGFLLGETNVFVTRTMTDSDSHNVKLHKVINIKAVVTCPRTCSFYNNAGKLDVENLESILGPEIKNVVAWFKYEPESRFKLSMRDKFVHVELSTSGLFPIPTDLFSCCLLSSSNSHMESTHAYVHAFLRYKHSQFINVPLHIANLGELSNCYKPKVQASKSFSDLCQSIGVPKKGVYDLNVIDEIQDKLHSEVSNTMTNLSESEYVKEQLEQEYLNTKLEMEYFNSILEEKALADAKAEEERRRQQQQDELKALLSSQLNLDILKLSDDESNAESREEEEIPTCKNLKNDLHQIKKVENKDVNKNVATLEDQVRSGESEDLFNSSNGSNSEDTSLPNNSRNENLIDLTQEEDKSEEEYKVTTRSNKISYAQIMSKNKYVQNS